MIILASLEYSFTGKSQTQETLKGFLRRAQNEFGLRIKKIRSDNGTEFKKSLVANVLFLLKEVENLNLLLRL
jgi:hypothetical protein